jgi:hypothetical protein
VRFSYRMVPEVYQVFWAGMAAGEFISDAAIAAGSYRKQGSRWLAAAGGVRPDRQISFGSSILPSTCIAHETVRPSLFGERRGK